MTKAGESILRGAREALDYAGGENKGYMVHVPDVVDVKAIRQRNGLSQARFAALYGFSPASIKNWEQGRRHPDVAARAYLLVIANEPEAVHRALSTE